MQQQIARRRIARRAIRLYRAVRDDVIYDPYGFAFDVVGLRASTTLANRRGWCVAKTLDGDRGAEGVAKRAKTSSHG